VQVLGTPAAPLAAECDCALAEGFSFDDPYPLPPDMTSFLPAYLADGTLPSHDFVCPLAGRPTNWSTGPLRTEVMPMNVPVIGVDTPQVNAREKVLAAPSTPAT